MFPSIRRTDERWAEFAISGRFTFNQLDLLNGSGLSIAELRGNLHNLVHLIFGIWGVLAYRSYGAARTYARVVAVVYALLAVMGLVPGLDTTFGLVPLFSHDVWLHIVLATGAAYFGFMHRETEARDT